MRVLPPRGAGRGAPRVARSVVLLLVTLGVCLVVPLSAHAGHQHSYAPCWGNGMGDGADNDGWFHPYIHYNGCHGPNPLYPRMATSAWFVKSTGVAERRAYLPCGYAIHCHFDFYPQYAECWYKAGVKAGTALAHHYHHHHYFCGGV